jgi:DnaJ-class molecular chaperone
LQNGRHHHQLDGVLCEENPSQHRCLHPIPPDHYATLGLDQRCTDMQIRTAYRLLAKQLHPDVNGGSSAAVAQTQALNAAYEILGNPKLRREYDAAVAARQKAALRPNKAPVTIRKDAHLRLEEFLRGTRLKICVDDPGQSGDRETYELIIPPGTAPGARFRLLRKDGGRIDVRVKAQPDYRFKSRGSDLRCDLKISFQRASLGGMESVRGVLGNHLRVQLPPKVARGDVIRLPGEGLPKARGGRGDLLLRVIYTPRVQISRTSRH